MTRRRLTILFHWLSFVLLILLLAASTAMPVLAWAFALSGLAMAALALVRGLMNRPGPRLEGALRTAHPWLSRAMYLALAYVAAATALAELGRPLPGPPLKQLYFVLLSMSSLHAVFHLWRHTALGDGALRRITPHALHGLL